LRNHWKITGLDPGVSIIWKVEVLPERCDEILIEQYLLSGPTCPVPIKALLGQILVIHFLELFLDHFMCTEEERNIFFCIPHPFNVNSKY
jgi:hypothetical protein